MENIYYNAKSLKEDDLDAAYEGFLGVIEKSKESEDSSKNDWAFKAKKQMIKTLFEQGSSKYDQVLKQYVELLDYLGNGKVASSYAEKSFTNMLDHLTQNGAPIKGNSIGSKFDETVKFIESVYTETLKVLVKVKNERMWIKTNLKLAKFYTGRHDIDKALGVLTQVQDVCLGKHIPDSVLKSVSVKSEEPTVTASAVASLATSSDENNIKSSYLIEVYAQMISLYSQAENYKKVKEIYRLTEGLTSAVTHPRILAVIREAGGKMHMREKRYELARQAFFDSFRNYDEAGSLSRISVLKYYVLACMLSETKINPFESQETRPYKNDPQINTMVQLVDAFQNNDTEAFQTLLSDKTAAEEIQKDQFIKEFIKDIELSARALGILKLVKPYSRVRFSKLAESLNISEDLVEEILTFLILDTKLPRARLDYQDKYVSLHVASVVLDPKTTYPGQNSEDSVFAAKGNSAMVDDSSVETALFAGARGLGIPGGLAPVLRTHQTPTSTLKLVGDDGQDEPDPLKALQLYSNPAPLLANDNIININKRISEKDKKNHAKSGKVSKTPTYLLNTNTSVTDIQSLFNIPKRYRQAIEESETVAGSQKVTTEGTAGAAPGDGSSLNVGGSGPAEAVPSTASVAGPSTLGGASGSTTSKPNPKSVDGSFRAGSIDPENPHAWRARKKYRNKSLLLWAKSVNSLQQITQKGQLAGSWSNNGSFVEENERYLQNSLQDLRSVGFGAVDKVFSELTNDKTLRNITASSVIWANTSN